MKASGLDPTRIIAWMSATFLVNTEKGILIWLHPPKGHPRLRGTEAGSFRTNHSGKRYCFVKYNKIGIKRSWLIFLWVHGFWPRSCLDHINGNSEFDGISNIREATNIQNAWNHKARAKAALTPMGVRKLPSGQFQARIAANKKQIVIGTFATEEAASCAYQNKRKELFGEFA